MTNPCLWLTLLEPYDFTVDGHVNIFLGFVSKHRCPVQSGDFSSSNTDSSDHLVVNFITTPLRDIWYTLFYVSVCWWHWKWEKVAWNGITCHNWIRIYCNNQSIRFCEGGGQESIIHRLLFAILFDLLFRCIDAVWFLVQSKLHQARRLCRKVWNEVSCQWFVIYVLENIHGVNSIISAFLQHRVERASSKRYIFLIPAKTLLWLLFPLEPSWMWLPLFWWEFTSCLKCW